MLVLELREKAAEAAQAARDIKEKCDQESRGMTSDEAIDFDAQLLESKRLEKEADRQEALEATEMRLNKKKDRAVELEPANGKPIEIVNPEYFRYGSLKAFRGKDAKRDAYSAGKWLMATVMGHTAQGAVARQWCRDHEIRVQTEGINTAGGFIVPTVMETAIIDLREEYGLFRKEARILPMSSDHTLIPRRSGGVDAYFVGETTAITESDKSWNQVELTAKKLGALTRMSTDLSEDSIINLADDLAGEMAYAFAVKEDACGIDGDGTATYGNMTGIRTMMIDGAHAGSFFINVTPGDQWNEILVSDLTSTAMTLPMYARANAKWYCHPLVKATVFDRLALAIGGNSAVNLGEGAMQKFMGYPIVESASMPSVDAGTAMNGLIGIIFGDMKLSTTLGDRRGITVKVSTERYLEYDQIGIQATERFCIVNHDIGGGAGVYGPLRGLQMNT